MGGQLKVTVMHAEGLVNLTYNRGKKTGSNPYCRVFCYPRSPADRKNCLIPQAWRSPLNVSTLSPKWNASHTFDFWWMPSKGLQDARFARRASRIIKRVSGPDGSDGQFARRATDRRRQVSNIVQGLEGNLKCLREDVRSLNQRVTRFSLTPEPPAEPMSSC